MCWNEVRGKQHCFAMFKTFLQSPRSSSPSTLWRGNFICFHVGLFRNSFNFLFCLLKAPSHVVSCIGTSSTCTAGMPPGLSTEKPADQRFQQLGWQCPHTATSGPGSSLPCQPDLHTAYPPPACLQPRHGCTHGCTHGCRERARLTCLLWTRSLCQELHYSQSLHNSEARCLQHAAYRLLVTPIPSFPFQQILFQDPSSSSKFSPRNSATASHWFLVLKYYPTITSPKPSKRVNSKYTEQRMTRAVFCITHGLTAHKPSHHATHSYGAPMGWNSLRVTWISKSPSPNILQFTMTYFPYFSHLPTSGTTVLTIFPKNIERKSGTEHIITGFRVFWCRRRFKMVKEQ